MERTDHLVCLVCLGRWVPEVFRGPVGSTDSPDPPEYPVLRDHLVLRAMRGLQDLPDPPV